MSPVALASPSFVLQSITIVGIFAFAIIGSRELRFRIFTRLLWLNVGAMIVISSLAPSALACIGNAVTAVATLVFVVTYRLGARRRWLARAAQNPLVLAPPFLGTWRVAAGGPDRGRNHHLIASDQRFAYDFIRCGAATLDSTIVSPVAGQIVAAQGDRPDHKPSNKVINDALPFGNHVAIDTGRGIVFLCHLRNGSVCVRVGDRVAAGTAVGRCGNSGRTSRPHLHIHAQDLKSFAFDRALGIPIVFRTSHGQDSTLLAGDSLTGSTPNASTCRSPLP